MVTPVQQRSNAYKCSSICSKAVSYLPAGANWPTERTASLQNSLLQILSFSLNLFSSDREKRSISTTKYFRWNSSLKEKKTKQQNKISHKPHMSHSNWACKWQPDLVPLHPPGAVGGPKAASPAALHQAQPNPLLLGTNFNLNRFNSNDTENVKGLTNVCRIYGTGPSHPFTSQTSA